ncbi:MAG: pseudouridine synthase [Leptolyngbyaceae cyanobacterium bins.59]|nr:pseudouridine synthase [Leptolyngbyaceae cyanobacterium bins.59]
MDERLQKIIAQWGIASRRQAEQLILDGRVRLNHSVALLGQKANPDTDYIEVDGKAIHPKGRPPFTYVLVNKPVQVVSTCQDPWGRPTVLSLLPSSMRDRQGLHPVGRLDADSTGALLLTNDGSLTFRLTHPRHQIPKTYEVWVKGFPSHKTLNHWQRGVMLSGKLTLPAQIRMLESSPTQSLLEIVLVEGRNRQIRRVSELLGHPVVSLHRVAIGSITLQNLASGSYRLLTQPEIEYLSMHTAITPGFDYAKS